MLLGMTALFGRTALPTVGERHERVLWAAMILAVLALGIVAAWNARGAAADPSQRKVWIRADLC